MNKKPHILFRLLPPIIAFLAGFGFIMIHGLISSEGGSTSVEMPVDPLDLGFLITSGIVVIIFPLLSRSWVSSFLSPLLYFGALILSSENFFGFVGLGDLWVFPADFTASGVLVLNIGAGIFSVGFLGGLIMSIVHRLKGAHIKKEIPVSGPGTESRLPPETITIEPGEAIIENIEPPEEETHPFGMIESEPAPGSEESPSEKISHTFEEPESKSKPSQPESADSEPKPVPGDQEAADDSSSPLGRSCETDPDCSDAIAHNQKTIAPDDDVDSDAVSDRLSREHSFDPESEQKQLSDDFKLDPKSESGSKPKPESRDSELDPESESGPDPNLES